VSYKYVGQPTPRKEDPKLLTGRAGYIGDVVVPGMLHAAVLRSPHAHARIRSIDASAARALPGVVCVLTGAESPTVTGIAVQQVVQPLRDGEEPCITVEDEPPVVDPRPPAIGQQRLQHLGNPTTVGRGIDVPDRAVPEHGPRSRRRLGRAPSALGRQDAGQQLERERLDVDFLHADILT